MIPVAEIKAKLARRWLSHYLPDSLSVESDVFPLRVGLKPPTDQQLRQDFEAVKRWVQDYAQWENPPFRIEWQSKRTSLGKNDFPRALVFEHIEQLAAFIQQTQALKRYQRLSHQLIEAFAALKPFCQRAPAKVLHYDQAWPKLLAFMQWRWDNPEPNLYLRQVPLTGIDSKFLEAHKAILAECFNAILPTDQIHSEFSGVKQFCARFGFLDQTEQLQARLLDPNQSLNGFKTFSAPINEWQTFAPQAFDIQQVWITENKVNFLAFPALPNSLILFGQGFGFAHWQRLSWLKDLPIDYWGDIDTHGFAILNQLRQVWPQTTSLLMDEATLLAHRPLWGTEPKPTRATLNALTPDEQALYQALQHNRFGPAIRLEQERIAYDWLQSALPPC